MRMKRAKCILLACCMAIGLYGCRTDTEEKKNTAAQYFEYEMELPEDTTADSILYMGTDPEGKLRILSYDKTGIYLGTYCDERWKQEKIEVFEKDSVKGIGGCFYGEDDVLYFLMEDENKEIPFYLCRSTDGKEYEKIRLEKYPKDEFEECMVNRVGVTAQGDFVFSFWGRPGIYIYDEQGKDKHQITKELEPMVCGNTIYAVSSTYGYLKSYDTANAYEAELLGDTPQIVCGVTEDEEGNLYYADSLGIHKRRINGSLRQLLADGRMGQMSGTDCSVRNMAVADGRIYILYSQTDTGAKLCEYRYEEKELEDEKELSVYSLTENNTVEEAIRVFCREHPNYTVQYTWGAEDNTVESLADAQDKLDAGIQAGEAADVWILDNASCSEYMEKGVLLELDEWMEEKTAEGEYYDSVLTAEEYRGHDYVVPVKFGAALAFSREEYGIDTVQIAEKLRKEEQDESFLGAVNPGRCAAFFLRKDAAFYSKAPYEIEEEKLAEELRAIKEIMSHSRIDESEYQTMQYDYKGDASVSGYDDAIFAQQQHMDVLEEGKQRYFCGETKSLYGLVTYDQAAKTNGAKLVTMDDCFYPHCLAAVNKTTEEKELAMDFLDCLLSEKVQKKSGMDGLPVNRAAAEELLQKYVIEKDDADAVSLVIGTGKKSYSIAGYTKEQAEAYLRMFGELKNAVAGDSEYYSRLADEALPYLEGKISVEKAVENMVELSKEREGMCE